MCILCELDSTNEFNGAHLAMTQVASLQAAGYDEPEEQHEPDGVIDFGTTPYTDFTGTSSTDQNVNGVLVGRNWTDFELTYSFPSIISDYDSGSYPNYASHAVNFSSFDAKQEASAEYWLDLYAEVSGLSFVELDGAPGALDEDQEATLRFANSTDPGTAYAYYPGYGGAAQDYYGDMWFNGAGDDPDLGEYDWHTVGHELGHALGLSHGHTSDNGYGAMNANRDSMEFSIMTYRSYENDPLIGGYSNAFDSYAQTLMMYDIAAIQFMYGANFSSNASSTTYTFSTTTGEMSINGSGQGTPVGNKIFRTIWDGNGSADHYDFSNYTTDLLVDLRPGQWSDLDVGGNAQRANLGDGNFARGHVFNALQFNGDSRSLIERGSGGSGDDTIWGNSANNVLYGNAGNDTIDGSGPGDQLSNDILYGGAGDDYLDADSGNDTLYGGTGSDTFIGDAGTDFMYGATGVDGNGDTSANFLYGGNDSDFLRGGDGNDSLFGGADDDELRGNAGNDVINGGAGIDEADYFYATSAVTVNLATGTATGGDGTDTLIAIEGIGGSGFNDVLTGDAGDNVIFGGNGNDTIDAGAGQDIVYGGAGNDTINDTQSAGPGDADEYYGGSGTDTVVDIAGWSASVEFNLLTGFQTVAASNRDLYNSIENLTVSGEATVIGDDNANVLTVTDDFLGDNTVNGNGGNDSIYSGSGDDTVDGGDGVDFIYSGAGDDSVEGGAGSDSIYGGDGNDGLDGGVFGGSAGSGNDFMVGGNGNDVVDGDDGADTLYGNNSVTGGGVSTETNTLVGDAGNDTLYGADGNDALFGGDDDDFLRGNGGNDTIQGGAGIDRASYFYATSGVIVNLATGTASGGDGIDTLIDIENLDGSNSYGDNLTGDGGDNVIRGYGGNDTINAGSGADTVDGGSGDDLFIDTESVSAALTDAYEGGSGSDTVRHDLTWNSGVSFNLETGEQTFGGTTYDTYSNIENLEIGGSASIIGDGNANVLTALAASGANVIEGGGGDDTIYAGGGNDTIDGGLGDDLVFGGDGDDVISDGSGLSSGTDTIYGGAGNDTIIQTDGLVGDFLDGGSGIDTLDHSGLNVFGGTIVNLATGVITFDNFPTNPSTETAINFENFLGDNLAEQVTGTSGVNDIQTNDGDDTVNAGSGADTVDTGDGDDIILDTDGTTNDFYDGGLGVDLLDYSGLLFIPGVVFDAISGYVGNSGGLGTDDLFVNIENITASQGNDIIISDGSGEFRGDDGDDTIFAGLGAIETLDGGAGNDTVDTTSWTGDYVLDLNSGGTNYSPESFINFENAVTGDGNDDVLGTSGANSISTGLGNDMVEGGEGDDNLDGGVGVDTVSYANAAGSVVVDLSAGTASGADGNDTLANFENIEGSGFDDDLTSDNQVNIIRGLAGADDIYLNGGNDTGYGGDGNDRVYGGVGADTLYGDDGDDRLFGEGGADEMYGGQGDDRLVGSLSGDTLYGGLDADDLRGNGGSDDIFGGLGDDSISAGGGKDNVEGGDGADTITGGGGKDIIDGGDGDDVIAAENGSDTITGGAGFDIFVFDDADKTDTITDFEDLIDLIDISSTGLSFGDLTISSYNGGLSTRIEFGATTVKLDNILNADIDSSDFIF